MTGQLPLPGESEPIAAAAKSDPEALVLRASPARVTRFRRGAIILIAGVGATAIAGVTWMAFRPVSLDLVASDDERSVATAKAPAEALAGAPSGYGDVPKLGAPLPGDLGRPILNHQRGLAMSPPDSDAEAAARAEQDAETERQRLAAEQKAARESNVMLKLGGRTTAEVAGAAETMRPNSINDPHAGASADAIDAQRRTARIGGASGAGDINPHALVPPVSPWTLQAGSVIAASLITGLNSDLPGFVTAQVTENVHDSVTGRYLLIPQGSRLIGSYDDAVSFGQSRALLVWQRIILPDGSSIRIDNVPATDTEGYAGLADRIDRHSWQLLKGVALSTLLGVGTELGFGSDESDLVRAMREATQQSAARAGDQIVMKSLDVQPTLKVRPGWPLRVVVHKDIVIRQTEAPGR